MTMVYLTASQVAERLQVSVSWVYKHKHLLGGIRVGERMWRFPEERLHGHLDSQPRAAGGRARRASDGGAATHRWGSPRAIRLRADSAARGVL
jgi:excisionase family DNA binding protein